MPPYLGLTKTNLGLCITFLGLILTILGLILTHLGQAKTDLGLPRFDYNRIKVLDDFQKTTAGNGPIAARFLEN